MRDEPVSFIQAGRVFTALRQTRRMSVYPESAALNVSCVVVDSTLSLLLALAFWVVLGSSLYGTSYILYTANIYRT